jgi:hypothetical protein
MIGKYIKSRILSVLEVSLALFMVSLLYTRDDFTECDLIHKLLDDI